MKTYHPNLQRLAIGLSALAGYIDAIGFLSLNGLFVSFMSGNSTQMSVGLTRPTEKTLVAAILIGLFVVGVVLGSAMVRLAKDHVRTGVVGLVTVLLTAAAAFADLQWARASITAMTLAMGAVNVVFEREKVQVGVTYMTGALVKLGQAIAGSAFGEPIRDALPHLKLWLGLVVGALLGGVAFPHLGLHALWPAAIAGALLTVAAHRTSVRVEPPPTTAMTPPA